MSLYRDTSGWVERLLRTVEGRHWEEKGPGTPGLVFMDALGRMVREGSLEEQATSTYRKIKEAIHAERYLEAAGLIEFFVDEATMPRASFDHRIEQLHDYMRSRNVSLAELEEIDVRLLSVLTLPDGREFHRHRLWEEFRARAREVILLCGGADQAPALSRLEELKETWRELFDRYVNFVYGLYNEVAVRFGEAALADTHPTTMWKERYERFDVSSVPWEESLPAHLQIAIEARRTALSGPERAGDVEVAEDEDRYILRFDPCGSGGRTLRGEPLENAPPITDPPFSWGVTTETHDFAWNKKGVCYFCINCCIMQQLKPIDEFGYPVRPVEPPTIADPDAKCTWYIYKDPTRTPEEFYSAVGRSKPERFGSARDKR